MSSGQSTSRWPDFRFVIRDAELVERDRIEAGTASGESLGSDACMVVSLDDKIIGWGDDYGTFHVLPAPTSDSELERAGEALLAAAAGFYAVTLR